MRALSIYALVLFGTLLSALGPSCFILLLREGLNRELGVTLLLVLGGVSTAVFTRITSSFTIPGVGSLSRGVILKLVFRGILVAVALHAFTISMQKGSVTETTLMVRVSPLVVIVMGHYFLQEKVRSWIVVAVASFLCFGGIFFAKDASAMSFQNASFLAMCWAMVSAFSKAGGDILSSSLTNKHDNLPNSFVVCLTMIFGGLLLLLFVDWKSVAFPDTNQIMVLILIGIFTTAIPSIISNYAYHIVGNTGVVTYFSFLVPVFGSFAAFFIAGERELDYQRLILSFLIISVGVGLIVLVGPKKEIKDMQSTKPF